MVARFRAADQDQKLGDRPDARRARGQALVPLTDARLGPGTSSTLYRDDLGTGAHDRIAAETVQALNNSDLFAVSPDGAWLAVAAGSGVVGEAPSTAIAVKHLSPPAGAATP